MNDDNFKSERISRKATIIINAEIGRVFPLFGAFDERKWADGWEPRLIYPNTEILEEGTTFKTTGNSIDDSEFLWMVSKYEPAGYLVQYLVSTPSRFWTITVKCCQQGDKTTADITYTFTGLTEKGNEYNRLSLDKMYSRNLEDWAEAINHFITHGKILRHNH